MLMFFFSPEHAEVERVRRELIEAGIPCEIHETASIENPPPETSLPGAVEEELWLENDADSHRAIMVCVALGVGFARREALPELLAFARDFEPEGEDATSEDNSNGPPEGKRWAGPTAGWHSTGGCASETA